MAALSARYEAAASTLQRLQDAANACDASANASDASASACDAEGTLANTAALIVALRDVEKQMCSVMADLTSRTTFYSSVDDGFAQQVIA
jgi:hypothetical protein